MADTVVEVPGIGPVAFPESMSQGEIEQAAVKLYRSQQSGASRFVSGAVSAVNPMPLVSQLADVVKDPVGQAFGLKPGIQNLKSALHAQLDQAITAAQTAKKALDGEGDAGTWQGKLMAASEALGHGVAAVVPVFGPAAAHAGERIAEGDTAGGLGEGAGLVGSVVAPRVIPKVAGATVDAAKAVATHPITTAAARGVIKPGATALGASIGGPAGAVVGSSVGDAIVNAMKKAPVEAAPVAVDPAVAAGAADLGSGRVMGAAEAVSKLNALSPEARAAAMAARGEAVTPLPRLSAPGGRMRPPPVVDTPPPVETPGAGNNVTPPAMFQPKPATTPANTPPRGVPVAEPPVTTPPVTKTAAPSPKVQAAAETISEWTKAEYDAVKDLPVKQRVAYLRMRQGGYAVDDAMSTVQQMQKAEAAQTLRAMKGSKKAAAELFNVSEKKVTPEMIAKVKEMAPGPSRTPLEGVDYAMDERFKSIIKDDPRFQSLVRGGGLGDLATRGAP